MSFFFFGCPRTINNIVNIYRQIALLMRIIDRNIDNIIDRLRALLGNKPIEFLYRSVLKKPTRMGDNSMICDIEVSAPITCARLAMMFRANVTEFTNLPVPILIASAIRPKIYKNRNTILT